MSRFLTYSPLDASNPVGDLADLVFRRAPQMMKMGGGALPSQKAQEVKPITPAEHDKMVILANAKKSIREIAHETGFSRNAVACHTRAVRRGQRA